MLINFQLPFADLRSFLPVETHRLEAPSWPSPYMDEYSPEFVHNVGGAAQRKRTRHISYGTFEKRKKIIIQDGLGDRIWISERTYCRARNMLKFPTLQQQGHLQCVFRRLFSDGVAANRLDLGFRVKLEEFHNFEQFQADFLNLEVEIKPARPKDRGREEETAFVPLCDIGGHIARKYLIASTQRKAYKEQGVEKWWVQPSTPVVIFLFSDFERDTANEWLKDYPFLKQVEVDGNSYSIHYQRQYMGERRARQEVIAYYIVSQNSVEGMDNLLRDLRVNLLRAHAEKACVMQVIRNIKRRKLDIDQEPLQSYILDTLQNLFVPQLPKDEEGVFLDILQNSIEYDQWANKTTYSDIEDLLKVLSPELMELWKGLGGAQNPAKHRDQVLDLIAQNRISEAFQHMEIALDRKATEAEFLELIGLRRRWSENKKDEMLNSRDDRTLYARRNQIAQSLVELTRYISVQE